MPISMRKSASPAEFQLTKLHLWTFRVFLYSFPIAFLCSAIYCYIHHIPNPRSVVPKSVICLVSAIALGLYINVLDVSLRTTPKEKRQITIGVLIVVPLVWLVILLVRNNSEFNFTGDGDPIFPILWLFLAIARWSLGHQKSPKEPELTHET
jgi:hypothetical protein